MQMRSRSSHLQLWLIRRQALLLPFSPQSMLWVGLLVGAGGGLSVGARHRARPGHAPLAASDGLAKSREVLVGLHRAGPLGVALFGLFLGG